MKFHYVAYDKDGRKLEDDFIAEATSEVIHYLTNKGLKPVSIEAQKATAADPSRRVFGQKITINDKIFLTKYLALMLKVGTDIFKAIDILIHDFNKPVLKSLLVEVRTNLEKGQPLYTTFARYPHYFSAVFINLIKAGESSGNLEQAFADLNVSLEKEKDLKGKIKAALIYPLLLLGLSFVILIFLITFALPKIAAVFEGGGIQPPVFSRIVFAVGLYLGNHIVIIIPSIVAVLALIAIFFLKMSLGKKVLAYLGARLPVFKGVVERVALQRFATTLSSLMKSGLPILNSLEITAGAVNHAGIRHALERIAREHIPKGITLGESFRREPAFPSVVSNLIGISERTGHLDEILQTLSGFYEAEVESSLKTLVAFIEPMLLLVIAVVVGTIALSIIVPIYQLVGQF